MRSDGINKYRKAQKGNTWEHLRRRKKGYLQGRAKYFIKRASILHKRAQGRGQRALTSIERHKRKRAHLYIGKKWGGYSPPSPPSVAAPGDPT